MSEAECIQAADTKQVPAEQNGGDVEASVDKPQQQAAVSLPFESFLEDGSLPCRPSSFIEETYEMRYRADHPQPGDDMWVRSVPEPKQKGQGKAYFHPNNVVVVGITRLHRALHGQSATGGVQDRDEAPASEDSSLEVKYAQDGEKCLVDVRDNGKMQKKTGVWVTTDTTICELRNKSFDQEPILCKSCVQGKFLAANKALSQDASILLKRPHDEGFLFIVCMFPDDKIKALNQLLTREQYCELRALPVDALR